MRVTFSEKARADLFSIGEYIAGDSPSRALSFMDELEVKASSLGEAPNKGVQREALHKGLRLLVHGAYGIYYTIEADRVRISRILHSALDLNADDFLDH